MILQFTPQIYEQTKLRAYTRAWYFSKTEKYHAQRGKIKEKMQAEGCSL